LPSSQPPVPPTPTAQPRPVYYRLVPQAKQGQTRRPAATRLKGCLRFVLVALLLVLSLAIYLLIPGRTNILVTGIDFTDPGTAVARTDAIMLTTFSPLKPYIGVLSVPRDLWVVIPGVGENRINTAHFYAESVQPGSGPQALQQTIQLNFDLKMDYYVRIHFEGFRDIVDALGGVDIYLETPKAGYPAGWQHLTGRKALAFVRDRSDSDDFFRMSDAQLMMKSLFLNCLNPFKWPRLPAVIKAFFDNIETDLPAWMWPRLGIILLSRGPNGIDYHMIDRNLVTPFTTDQGAQVLRPNWELIYPLAHKIFGKP